MSTLANGETVTASCCERITTTTLITTPMTTESTQITSKSIINRMINFLIDWKFPLVHFQIHPKLKSFKRVKRQISDIPKAAAECIFADGGKTNPVPDYMSFDEKGLTCRAGQIMLNSTRSGVEVYCCRYSSSSSILQSDVPKAIASKCVFEGAEPLMWSMHTPGNDLVCKDPDNFEVVTLPTTHLITGKVVSMACCKKIETTTTEATSENSLGVKTLNFYFPFSLDFTFKI